MNDLPQTFMEPLLFKTACSRGTQARMSTEYLSHRAGCRWRHHHVPRPADRQGHHHPLEISGRGGWRQFAGRRACGLPFEGKMGVGGSMNILFKADLSKYVAHRPIVLYWVLQPGANVGGIGMGLVRMVRPWNEWLIVWGYDINEAAPEVDDGLRHQGGAPAGRRPDARDRAPVGLDLDRQQHVRDRDVEGPRLLHGRRRPPPSAVQRARLQHLDPGRASTWPGSWRGAEGPGRAGAARQLRRRTRARSPSRSSPAPTSRSGSSGRSSRRSACSTPSIR